MTGVTTETLPTNRFFKAVSVLGTEQLAVEIGIFSPALITKLVKRRNLLSAKQARREKLC